jgi:hypothetical protein
MKFIRDWKSELDSGQSICHSTYHQLLQIILKRRSSEKKTPMSLIFEEGLITLTLEVLQNMSFVKNAALDRGKIVIKKSMQSKRTFHPIRLKNLRSLSSP